MTLPADPASHRDRLAIRRGVRPAAAALILLGAGFIAPTQASAANVGCGQTITASTVLDGDVGPCHGFTALTVGAPNIVLDLGGHTLFGDALTGILLGRQGGVQITNGTVQGFGTGILIVEGSGNTISRLRVTDSTADAAIRVQGASASNRITQNVVARNRANGIALAGTFTGPVLPGHNVVEGNVVDGNGGGGIFALGPDNVVANNTVTRNGRDGIVTGSFQTQVRRNLVTGNGFGAGARAGDGIRVDDAGLVFPNSSGDVVEANAVYGNAGHGVHVVGIHPQDGVVVVLRSNRIIRNATGRNGGVDLLDESPGNACDNNVWSGNTYQTAFPACTTSP